jgi:hypothetical protein
VLAEVERDFEGLRGREERIVEGAWDLTILVLTPAEKGLGLGYCEETVNPSEDLLDVSQLLYLLGGFGKDLLAIFFIQLPKLIDISFSSKEYPWFLPQPHIDNFFIDGQLTEILDDPLTKCSTDIHPPSRDVSQWWNPCLDLIDFVGILELDLDELVQGLRTPCT